LFKKKRLNIEEEVEFLFDNDLERQKKLRNEKIDFQTMKFINLVILGFVVFFFLKELKGSPGFVYLYLWLIIITVWGLFTPSDKLKYLHAIDLLKRRFKENENACLNSDDGSGDTE